MLEQIKQYKKDGEKSVPPHQVKDFIATLPSLDDSDPYDSYTPSFKHTGSIRYGVMRGINRLTFGGDIFEDILCPPIKELSHENLMGSNNFIDSDRVYLTKDYMDVKREQENYRGIAFVLYFFTIGLFGFWTWSRSHYTATNFEYWIIAIGLVILLVELLRPRPLPIRFHYKNQEVYAYHKGKLYKIPWTEFQLSLLKLKTHVGEGATIDRLDMICWLYAEHEYPPQPNRAADHYILNNESVIGDYVSLWKGIYIFMQYGKAKVVKYDKEIKDWKIECQAKETDSYEPSPITKLIIGTIFMRGICGSYIVIITFLSKLNPLNPRWPKIVKEWTGPLHKNNF